MAKKVFSLEDVRTLKNLKLDKLDCYIDYLSSLECIDRLPLEEAPTNEKEVILHFNKEAKWYYKYPAKLLRIVDIFEDYPLGQEFQFDIANNIRTALETKEGLRAMTPEAINFYINEVALQDRLFHGVIADNVEKGYFLKLLKLLKRQFAQYQGKAEYYERKYGKENLLSLDEDCENGRRAGNMAVATNPNWESEWKEFIKHDMHWDGKFLYFLLLHKLKLLRKYFDPDTDQTSLCERSARRNCRQIDKALELAKPLDEDAWLLEMTRDIEDFKEREKARERLYKKANRRFFLYLADHYEGWWD